jgi:hypothetical protein
VSEQLARAVLVTACCSFAAVIALNVFAFRHGAYLWAPLANAVLIAAIVLFERRRYRPPVDPRGIEWKPTGERFIDPTSGEMLAVYFNARTNERDYRPL